MILKNWKRLLTGILCVSLIMSETALMNIRSYAAETGREADTFVVNEEEAGNSTEKGESETEYSDNLENETGSSETVSEVDTEPERQETETETVEQDTVVDGEESNTDGTEEESVENEGTVTEEETPEETSVEAVNDTGTELPVEELLKLSPKDRLAAMASEDDIASGISDDIVWVINADGKLTVIGTGNAYPWSSYNTRIKTAEIIVTGITDMSGMFFNCSSLTSIDLSSLDTSNVTDMSVMFGECSSLMSIDLSSLDTSNVTDMSGMFSYCSSLTSIDLSNLDTSNVTDMSGMFGGCSSLMSIDLSNLDTSNVTDMSGMFGGAGGCSSLTSIDLSNLDTSNVTDMSGMFIYCSSLTSIDLSNLDTSNVTDMGGMFEECSSLMSIDLSSLDTSNVTDMQSMFRECSGLASIDLSGLDTSKVTDMGDMFYGCSSLTSIDLSVLNTSNVEYMNGIFCHCSSLVSINLNDLDTSNVIDMRFMFCGCNSLVSIDLSSFDTGNLVTGGTMFNGCSSLVTIYTPYNLHIYLGLPEKYINDVWYRSDGTKVFSVPKDLDYSVVLGNNYIPTEKGSEVDNGTITEPEIIPGYSVPKDKSVIYVIDRKTGKPIAGASLSIGEQTQTDKDGKVELTAEGDKYFTVVKGGYYKIECWKTLKKGKITIVTLPPDTRDVRIELANLYLSGKRFDVLNNKIYLCHKKLDQIKGEAEKEFKISVRSGGIPVKYQLLQGNKVIQENETGVFPMSGKIVEDKDGIITYYVEELNAGKEISVKVLDANGTYQVQKLGINVSKEPPLIESLVGAGLDFGEGIKVTLPDSIPILGGSEFDFELEKKLPMEISIEEDGKVRVAVNLQDQDSWEDKKDKYSEIIESAFRSGIKFGVEQEKLGFGMASADVNIVAYGEGYWDDKSESVCVKIMVVLSGKAEYGFQQYTFIPLAVPVPVYVTFTTGVSAEMSSEMLSVSISANDGLKFQRGSLALKPSIYLKPEAGIGVDGILAASFYGEISIAWLWQIFDDYNNHENCHTVTLAGSAGFRTEAFIWSKDWEIWKGEKVIYEKHTETASAASHDIVNDTYADGTDMSGAKIISMDYLSKRNANAAEYGLVNDQASETNSGGSGTSYILDHAYENASPRLLKAGNKLYLFYLDGVEGRSAQNQTALFYKISADNGATWSQAVRADGGANETADYNFDIAADGNTIYAVWSDSGAVYGDDMVSMDANEAIAKVGKEMNLMLAKINGDTGEIQTHTIETEYADLQPNVAVGNNGDVYITWIQNDVSAEGGLLSNQNKMSICYAGSAENYAVHSISLQDGQYPLSMDAGRLGTGVYMAVGMDTDGNMNTQEDREIYTMNLASGNGLAGLTSDSVVDSVPVFGRISGQEHLFWYQNGNIAYTADGQTVGTVFDGEALPVMGQKFSVLESENGKAAIIWTTTSHTKEFGVEVYCSDYDAGTWSSVYCLGELDSNYTMLPSGYVEDLTYRMAYLGTIFEGEELKSHICMFVPEKKTDTSIAWYNEADGAAGEDYPLSLTVTNTGNVAVDSLYITSADGSISDTLTGLSIEPGMSQTISWSGIVLPQNMTEAYVNTLTVFAAGESELADNTVALSVGNPDFAVEAYSDYSIGEQFAGVIVTNEGLVPSDAELVVYSDEEHTNELYRTSLAGVAGGEARITVFDLTAMDKALPVFYFAVSDSKGLDTNTYNNETLLYVGKGLFSEDEEEEEGQLIGITVEKTKTVYEYGDTLDTDDVTVTAQYSSGTTKKVSGYSTDAEKIDMYQLGQQILTVTYGEMQATVEIVVNPRMLDAETKVLLPYLSCVYDGTDKQPVPVSVTEQGRELVMGTDYTVSWDNNVNAGTAAVTITGTGHYQGTLTVNFTILKGAAPNAEEVTEYLSAKDGGQVRTLDISDRFMDYGEITGYEIAEYTEDDRIAGNVLAEAPNVRDGILSYRTGMGVSGDFAVIKVKVSFLNYESAILSVTVMITDKEKVIISGIHMPDSVYNGWRTPYYGTISVTTQGGELITSQAALTYSYSGIQADGSIYTDTEQIPVNAGSYVLTVAVSETDDKYIGRERYAFKITPATVHITAQDVTLAVGDAMPESYRYKTSGLLNGNKLLKEPLFTCNIIDTSQKAVYDIIPSDADAGMNYTILYHPGTLTVTDERVAYTVCFDPSGHGAMKRVSGISAGCLLEEPEAPAAPGYLFTGWYQDKECTKLWDFERDTVQENITLYAGWLVSAAESGLEGAELSLQEIADQVFTGKMIKPALRVYSGDGTTQLKQGKDYTVKYFNNIEADTEEEQLLGGISENGTEGENGFSKNLAYVVITGKGNYKGTIYKNFHIDAVSVAEDNGELAKGFTLKYKDQLVVNKSKAQKPFTSLKYKKAMKAGTDYEVKLTAVAAYDAQGSALRHGTGIDEQSVIPSIPAGYQGSFRLTVKGLHNYSGEVSKVIYVTDKNHLMKNVSVVLGKNIKKVQYTGQEIALTPAYYDAAQKKYYAIREDGTQSTEAEPDGSSVFTVKCGKEYLKYGRDYTITYANNDMVGTAAMTLTGIGQYSGTKKVTFRIAGNAFSAKNITIDGLKTSMVYTGKALTQNQVALTDKNRSGQSGGKDDRLVYGKDYVIRYTNNVKKGTAAMIFTAKPESGYTGSFKKTFKIEAAALEETVKVSAFAPEENVTYGEGGTIKFDGKVSYSKEGAKPSDRIQLSQNGIFLKEGTDYTVSYTNNKEVFSGGAGAEKSPSMIVKGKGNYKGILKVSFDISKAEMEGNENLTVIPAAVAYQETKAAAYQYQPKLKVTDGKKALSASKDYSVEYKNCMQTEVAAYLNALGNGTMTREQLEQLKPYVVITAKEGSGYSGKMSADLNIYRVKLTQGTVYTVIADTEQTTYTGRQICPKAAVYYGDAKMIKKAKQDKVTDERILTDENGNYRLTRLDMADGDYTITYGANIKAGKNKGTMTITGKRLYGGNVTVKFTIQSREVYSKPR